MLKKEGASYAETDGNTLNTFKNCPSQFRKQRTIHKFRLFKHNWLK